jgi:hypothetical protein
MDAIFANFWKQSVAKLLLQRCGFQKRSGKVVNSVGINIGLNPANVDHVHDAA